MKKNRQRRKRSMIIMSMLCSVCLLVACGNRTAVTDQVDELLRGESNTQLSAKQEVVKEEPLLTPKKEKKVPEPVNWGELDIDKTVVPSEEELVTPEDEMVDPEDKLQFVFLGDSIFDMARDGTGVPYLTAEACGASCYNLAIGGTCASLHPQDSAFHEDMDSSSVLGVAKAIAGEISPDVMDGYHARTVFDSCDFSKTDYFVVECGTNDFLAKRPIDMKQGGTYKWYTYYGAIEGIISSLQSAAPDAEIIFCTPHYETFYGKDKVVLGDVNTYDLGKGPLIDYIAAGHNAAQTSGAHAINCYEELNINGYTAADYLLDGIHLNADGRALYAEMLSNRILKWEMQKAN